MSARALALAIGTLLCAAQTHGQALRSTPVAGNVHMITGAGGNVAVSAGRSGVLVVDSGAEGASAALLAAIREISGGPIRYVLNTSIDPEHIGGNETLRTAGATFTGGNATVVGGVDVGAAIVAHEAALLRLADTDVPTVAQPTETFYVPRFDLYFNDEPVEVIYQPSAMDDTNVIVHFRRSDVIATGDVFRVDTYPVIDLENGGSINGLLDSLNGLIELTVSDTLSEGGTLIVPGHGRICDEADLVRYRDMLTVIRDRIARLVEKGNTLEQIKAAKPTLDYDSRYGAKSGPASPDGFIETVYRSLTSS